jgi:hypothetical protein
MFRLTEAKIIPRAAACSWCCGDLRAFVSRAGYQVVCVHCGRSIPVERHDPGCRTVGHAHPTGRHTVGTGPVPGVRCVPPGSDASPALLRQGSEEIAAEHDLGRPDSQSGPQRWTPCKSSEVTSDAHGSHRIERRGS